ncbi:hypothetical protein B0F90DRAFT_1671163 [Multifurca ochricompacta]|uniref:Uncharacterized protein n=1 Tax=Multifurca ochricompacta TaxID=376703 RepID=A0AAD4LY38_9AGAM|nr:hypothetical protein B0F90DRAFT_1671163 [Multifurca ochricompacta]
MVEGTVEGSHHYIERDQSLAGSGAPWLYCNAIFRVHPCAVGKLDRSQHFVRKRLGDILLKKCYLPVPRSICSRVRGGNVAREDLNVAIPYIGQEGEFMRPSACPSSYIDHIGDVRGVDLRQEELWIVPNSLKKAYWPFNLSSRIRQGCFTMLDTLEALED